MKILSTEQIRIADAFTIQNEPVTSIELMERASEKVSEWIFSHVSKNNQIIILSGTGNNGGDGLAVARMLHEQGFRVSTYLIHFSQMLSADCQKNYDRLKEIQDANLFDVFDESQFPLIKKDDVVIDAIFGSGLNKPTSGIAKNMIEDLNDSGAITISIDVPSGLYADKPVDFQQDVVVVADYTLSFQFPKLAFLFSENDSYVGQWEILPIGLHPQFIQDVVTTNEIVTLSMAQGLLKKRTKFSHKGTYGHALLIAASEGKTGAAILSAHACLRSGVGLLHVHLPQKAVFSMQTTLPEAMIDVDSSDICFSELPDLQLFDAVGVGPGLGTQKETEQALKFLIQETKVPLVLDADALNILSENKTWLSFLPPKTILTPHPKEFERLAGKTVNSFERLEKQREMSKKYGVIIVLKGAYTSITFPDGRCFFNSTGNPGMATAGSGDVLTGIILGLLAQNYRPEESAVLGVYLHGLAGDLASKDIGMDSLIASDIVAYLGKSFLKLREKSRTENNVGK